MKMQLKVCKIQQKQYLRGQLIALKASMYKEGFNTSQELWFTYLIDIPVSKILWNMDSFLGSTVTEGEAPSHSKAGNT